MFSCRHSKINAWVISMYCVWRPTVCSCRHSKTSAWVISMYCVWRPTVCSCRHSKTAWVISICLQQVFGCVQKNKRSTEPICTTCVSRDFLVFSCDSPHTLTICVNVSYDQHKKCGYLHRQQRSLYGNGARSLWTLILISFMWTSPFSVLLIVLSYLTPSELSFIISTIL